MRTRSEAYEARSRAVKTTRTYLHKSEAMLHADLPLDPAYWDLLDSALDVAFEILKALPDTFFQTEVAEPFFGILPGGPINLSDTPNDRAVEIVKLLEERRIASIRARRIALLEQVDGRTPEEAELYLAKATQLREEGH